MARPVVGISRRSFPRRTPTDLHIFGVGLRPSITLPRVKIFSKRHYWAVAVQNDSTDTDLHLIATPNPKRNATRDASDDMTVTITVEEGTQDEEVIEVVYDEITYTGNFRSNRSRNN